MAGKDDGDFFVRCEAAGAGVGEATVYASEFGVGGVVFACDQGCFDLSCIGGEFGLSLGRPGGGAGQGDS